MHRLILRTGQCPGDVVVMTAAVRELHRQYPNQYQTDVRTCAREIWEHNPFITPIADDDRQARTIQMHYPLINQSNQRPAHFLEAYCEYLAGQLGLTALRPQEFRGDIYLSDEECGWMNQVEQATGHAGPFWLVNAGSKNDFTCKQWPLESFQAVIDHFQESSRPTPYAVRPRIQFVQIGASEHNHPPLSGVIDLRGKTDHRQLIRLIYHSSGVLTGVSYPMHLAAAVPVKGFRFIHPEGTRGSGLREKESVGNEVPSGPRGVRSVAGGNDKGTRRQGDKEISVDAARSTSPFLEDGPPGPSRKTHDGLGRPSSARLRPCVVINGGREPPHWEQYPGHQFLHTIGALDCCATGGCWKSRVVALGDGDAKDRDLCPQPVAGHPRCMRMITPDDVIRAIEKYAPLECGDSSPLSLVAERPSVGNALRDVSGVAVCDDKETRGQGDKATSAGNALRGVPPLREDGLPSPSRNECDGLGRPSSLERRGEDGFPRNRPSLGFAPTAAPTPYSRTPTHSFPIPHPMRILIDFRHGLGDAVQLTTVLLHLRYYHPEWQIDVAVGVGKLPLEDGLPSPSRRERDGLGRPSSAPELSRVPLPLYDRLFVRERDSIDRGAYQRVFELAWDECPACYADCPSTKAEYCLRSVFNLEPIADLCRYVLPIGDDAMAKARAYLQSICRRTEFTPFGEGHRTEFIPFADGERNEFRSTYPVVLLHYQANTSKEKKDLTHELARRVCEVAIEAGFVPVILDWDHRSPLPGEKGLDGATIFNPAADHPLWGGLGTGDSETLAALIAQSALFIGIDSGPLHVAGAVFVANVLSGVPPKAIRDDKETRGQGDTENGGTIQNPKSKIQNPSVLAVWTGHHPLHYFGLADHVTHLVPEDHASRLRGSAALGQSFFDQHYHYRTYRQLEVDLPALVRSVLTGEPFEQARNKQFLRQLRATGYTEEYYIEHKLAGLDYLGFGDWQRQYGRWLVDALDLKAKRVLDVGCACGSILRGFGEAGAVAQGVDLNEAMVRRGRETWPDMAGLLHVCDAVNLHLYRDATWHALHSAQVAEHWKPELVPFILRELARVTVPGGLFFCALDTEELFARQNRRLEQEDPTHVCVRPMRWWHEQLAAAGWRLCTADYEPRLRAHTETFLTRYDWDWFVARRE